MLVSAIVTTLAVGCGSMKQVVKETAKTDTVAIEKPAPVVVQTPVDAHPDVISIAEAIGIFRDKAGIDAVVKKYKYKKAAPYGVYRLDRHDAMLYKNCRLPRSLGKDMYEDTPRPLAKGTSSYVAISESVTIAVFNVKAYDNLLAQVKALGFTLAETGYEDRYTNGTIDIYTYATNKRFRIEKSL